MAITLNDSVALTSLQQDEEFDDNVEEDSDGEDLVNFEGDYVAGADLQEGEEEIVRRYVIGTSMLN